MGKNGIRTKEKKKKEKKTAVPGPSQGQSFRLFSSTIATFQSTYELRYQSIEYVGQSIKFCQ